MKSKLCETCNHTNVCAKDKNIFGDVFVAGNPMLFDNAELYEKYKEREQAGFPCDDYQPEIVRCKDCKWWEKFDNLDKGFCHAAKHSLFSTNWEISIRRKYKGDFYCADAERREP